MPTQRHDNARPRRRGLLWGALALGMFLVSVVWLAPALKAQPVRDRVLEDIQIAEPPEPAGVRIVFAFPIRFAWIFPHKVDDVFLLRLVPVDVAPEDAGAVIERESVLAPGTEAVPLTEVAYDGETEGGPFLTLRFSRPVKVQARPAKDFRAIDVTVSLPPPPPADAL